MYNNHFFRVFSQIQATVNSSEIAKNVTVMCILTAYTVPFIYQTEFTVNFQNILFCFFSVCYNIIYVKKISVRSVCMHILVVEDERALCDTIVRSLKRLAYSVDFCYDGKAATELLAVEKFDLVVLDLNLPGEDGMSVLKTLRETDFDTKVLILSARCEVADKVAGLDAGANDYLSKPFHLDELAARIRNLTLRRFTQNDVILTCRELSFDTKARKASVNGETLSLTRKETGILEYLMLNQGRPISQEELIEHVWDSSVDNFSNSIRVHISALRKKLRTALGYDPISNRIGEGYVMEGK